MSKERLEEIKENWNNVDWGIDKSDINWLIEQAEQEHATSVQNTKLAVEFERLQQQNQRYREAIERAIDYADSGRIITAPSHVSKILLEALECE